MSTVNALAGIAKVLNAGVTPEISSSEGLLDFISGKIGVSVHFTTKNDAVVSDTTYTDIVAAITAGNDVVASYGNAMANSVAYDPTNNRIVFTFIGFGSNLLNVTTLTFAKAGTITAATSGYTLTPAA